MPEIGAAFFRRKRLFFCIDTTEFTRIINLRNALRKTNNPSTAVNFILFGSQFVRYETYDKLLVICLQSGL